jgi:hypothetical protein
LERYACVRTATTAMLVATAEASSLADLPLP